MCNDDIANLVPMKKFFNSVFMGKTFSLHRHVGPDDGGVR